MKSSRAQSWSIALGVAGAVHGAMIWAAVTSWGGAARTWTEPSTIELVAIQGGETLQEKGEAKPAPPPPENKPAPAPPPAVTSLPAPMPKPAVTIPTPMSAPAPPVQQQAAPAPEPAAPAQSAASAQAQAAAKVAAPPAPPAAPQRAGDKAGLNINAPRGKSLNYTATLRAWVEAHKTYPRHAKMRREEGVVEVVFIIDRQGHLLSGKIIRSSGVASLDQAALDALQRSNPFPAPPAHVAGDRIETTLPVGFEIL